VSRTAALNAGALCRADFEYLQRTRGNRFVQRLLGDAVAMPRGRAASPSRVAVQREVDLLNPKMWQFKTTDYAGKAAMFGLATLLGRISGLGDLDAPVKAYWDALVAFDRKSKVQLLQTLTDVTNAIGNWRTKYLKPPLSDEVSKAAGLVNTLELQAAEARVAVGAADFNPLDLIRKSDGIPNRITVHKQPGLGPGEAFGLPVVAAPGAATLSDKMVATIKKNAAAPLVRNDPDPPDESELYTLQPADPNAKEPGAPVKSVAGTLTAPRVVPRRIPNSIYIDNQPSIDDIRQYGFGDCYFLSTLIAVAERDPKRITDRLIQPDNGGMSVRLWQYESGGDKWTRQTITVDEKLAYTPGERELVGARFRVGPLPKTSRWYAEIANGVLSVVREAHFETALWVPLLEKAYAMFIEKFGIYGGQPERTGNAPPVVKGSGYASFNTGGQSEQVYYMYYGPELKEKPRFERTTFKSLPIYSNQTILERLLQFQTNDKLPAEHTMALTVNADKYQQLVKAKNLLEKVGAYHKHKAWKEVGLDGNDTQAFAKLQLQDGLSDEGLTKAKEKQSKGDHAGFELYFDVVADATTGFVAQHYARLTEKLRKANPDTFTELGSVSLHSNLNDFLKLCLTVTTIRAGGQREGLPKNTDRFLIAIHSYAVRKVDFNDSLGAPIKGLTVDNIGSRLIEISETQSRVTLQNPHRDNIPTGATAVGSPGVFALSLNDFLLGFDVVSSAVIPKTR
jgi:hypothetical protein